ncbi:MAG TPA: AraC family transcriptional regulator [Candidatus Solibacter sp.]|nr:AraC family transcriptional regulator [Candidatus Solibacter sp.]
MRRNSHYQDRVNRVLDYISEHLDGDLSLARLSKVACFSPFHFHRIFLGTTGETLNGHVRRVRLERAVLLMRTSPEERITDIALRVGFAGTAEFSRAFRSEFDMTASSWDRRSPLEKSKICKAPGDLSFHTEEELKRWKAANQIRVRVVKLNAVRYVYTRIFAPYGESRLVDRYNAMRSWLAKRGTDVCDVVFIGMSLDDPSITPAEHCRYDLGIAFPKERGGIVGDIMRSRGGGSRGGANLPTRSECEAEGITMRDLGPQQVASIRCIGDVSHEERAWHYLYRVWLAASGYVPADLPAMEMFVKLPEELEWKTFDLETCIPVERHVERC